MSDFEKRYLWLKDRLSVMLDTMNKTTVPLSEINNFIYKVLRRDERFDRRCNAMVDNKYLCDRWKDHSETWITDEKLKNKHFDDLYLHIWEDK